MTVKRNKYHLVICWNKVSITLIHVAAMAMVVSLGLTGCSGGVPKLSSLNPFAKAPPPRLEGERVSISPQKSINDGELAITPVILPAMIQNAAWSQPGGTANNAPGHLQLSTNLRQLWSADIGSGSTSYGRLTASPIVFDGRVYTLDSRAKVSAFSASGGTRTWRVNLTPDNENSTEGFGGGLAADAGRLYVATGFGRVTALNPATGKHIWEKNLGIPIRSSPTAAQNKVFVTTANGRFYCLNGENGEILWDYRGFGETTQVSSNPSPAFDGDIVTVPYPNGDVVAIQASTGTPLWSEILARTRASSFASMSDAARPAMLGGTVFAVGHGGRIIATVQDTGERLWTQNVPGRQAPWVTSNNVFVVDLTGKLSALTRQGGKAVWTIQLPDAKNWAGPVLAGGNLWLASDKGGLLGIDAASGRVSSKLSVGSAIFIAPVVANGKLFVLNDKGRLYAFR